MKINKAIGLASIMSMIGTVNAQTLPRSANLQNNWTSVREKIIAQDAHIAIVGDSLTWRQDALHDSFAEIFVEKFGGPVSEGWQSASVWTGATAVSAGWQRGPINEDVVPHWSVDGMWLASNNAACTAVMNPINQQGHAYFTAQPGGATIQVAGTAYNTENSSNTLLTVPYNSDTFSVQTSPNGIVTFLGVFNALPNTNIISKFANGGWGTDEFIRRNWTFEQIITSTSPDLFFVMLGQNDGIFGITQWRNQLDQVCDRLLAGNPSAKIILISSYDSSAPWLIPFNQQMYAEAIEEGYGYINLYQYGGNYSFYQTNGYLVADGIHFNRAGGLYVADFIMNILEPSVPAPQDKSLNISADAIIDECEGC